MSDVRITVQAIDNASDKLRNISKSLASLGKTSTEAGIKQAAMAQRSQMLSSKMSELGREVVESGMSTKAAAAEFDKYKETLHKVGGATSGASKESKGLIDNLWSMRKSFIAVAFTAGAAAFAVKKGFEFSREGAAIIQLADSFDHMNETVYDTPALLERMRASTRGTVKDTQLMSSVLTLSAGVTKEVAAEFGKAAPRLAEIAKAAQKVNPALGDTAFLLDSLALGIKRGSKLILDNLGLNVSLGVAHEKYAKTLGVTTDELSAQQQVLAVLYEVMEQGDVLIQQAGGNVDSYTDSWDQLSVAVGTFIEEMKKGSASGPFKGLADEIARIFNESNQLSAALRELQELVDLGIISEKTQEGFLDRSNNDIDYLEEVIEYYEEAAEAARQFQKANSEPMRMRRIDERRGARVKEIEAEKAAMRGLIGHIIEYNRKTEAGAQRQDAYDYIAQLEDLGLATQEQIEENEEYIKSLEEIAKAQAKIQQSTIAYNASISDGSATLGFFNEDLEDLGQTWVTVGGRTADQQRIFEKVGDEMDDLGQEISDITQYPAAFGLSIEEAGEKAQKANDRIAELQPTFDELGNKTGTTSSYIREATWNMDALEMALIDGTAAVIGQTGSYEENQKAVAAMRLAMGDLNDEQYDAIIRAIEMKQHIDALSIALGNNTVSADIAKQVLKDLADGIYENTKEALEAHGIYETWQETLEAMEEGYSVRIDFETYGVAAMEYAFSLLASLPQSGLSQDDIDAMEEVHNRPDEKHAGGPVERGETYIVGEKGPELFVPGQSGRIIPNNSIMGPGGIERTGPPRPKGSNIDISGGIDYEDIFDISKQLGMHVNYVRHADQFLELRDAVEKAEESFHSYRIGVKGANLSDEERYGKMEETKEEIDSLIAKQELLRGSYDMVTEAVDKNNQKFKSPEVMRGTADALQEQMDFMGVALGGMTSQRNILSERISGSLGALDLMGASRSQIQDKISGFGGKGGLGSAYARELRGVLQDMESREALENRIMGLQDQRMALAGQINQINIEIDASGADSDFDLRVADAVAQALREAGIDSANMSMTSV